MKYRSFRWAWALLPVIVSPLTAENRLYVPPVSLTATSEPQSFLVHGDNDVTVLGYSIALEVDPTAIELQAISASGTAAEEADFFEASLDSTAGLGGVGCVFDLGGDFSEKKLDPGTNQVLANVSVVILATETMTTEVVLRDISVHPERPPIRNVMTNENGVSPRAATREKPLSATVYIRKATPISTMSGRGFPVLRRISSVATAAPSPDPIG